MDRAGIYDDATARLSEIIERVEAGEEIVLTRRGRAVVRLIRADAVTRRQVRAATVKRIRALSKRMNLRISPADVPRAITRGRD